MYCIRQFPIILVLVLKFCLCTLYKYSLTFYYQLISFPRINLMSYFMCCIYKIIITLFYCQDPVCTVPSVIKSWNASYCPLYVIEFSPHPQRPQWNFTPTGFTFTCLCARVVCVCVYICICVFVYVCICVWCVWFFIIKRASLQNSNTTCWDTFVFLFRYRGSSDRISQWIPFTVTIITKIVMYFENPVT